MNITNFTPPFLIQTGQNITEWCKQQVIQQRYITDTLPLKIIAIFLIAQGISALLDYQAHKKNDEKMLTFATAISMGAYIILTLGLIILTIKYRYHLSFL